jgi:maltooligosyltrehalose trehalohydrolase
MTSGPKGRRFPIGAERVATGGVDFRVWAPKRSRVEAVFADDATPSLPLKAEGNGYFRGVSPNAAPASRYRFRLDGGETLFPDPASRRQPTGPHGPSEVIVADTFPWTDAEWRGVSRTGQVFYEIHLGTFTSAGTWEAAAAELGELARLGVTVIEVMPIGDFPGRFGWGYDGVNLFAPAGIYGSPDDARRFVDKAHGVGLGVILDVVYNHLGPDGNYLGAFSDTYFTDRYKTDWGPALNYDGDGSEGVRTFVATNAAYWVNEFHFDGLRLDATQNIYDTSEPHILRDVAAAVHGAARGRKTFIVAENESQKAQLVRPVERGGYGLDALWNDDFHHTARVALTGRREAYYTDYLGSPQELISALKRGFLYQGQHYSWQKAARGTASLDLEPNQLVTFLENHDQVANTFRGERLAHSSSPRRHRALVALLLLGPGTPLLFQGEEFASSRPFSFFADHHPELGRLVDKGRRAFLQQFPSVDDEASARIAPPGKLETFEACKLDFAERNSHAETYALYRDLLSLRRTDGVLGQGGSGMMDGAVLAPHAFVLRFFGKQPDSDRILLVNLGPDLSLKHAPEPLLAPPDDSEWTLLWSSEDIRYGGDGTPPVLPGGVFYLPGESAVALVAKEAS